METLLLIGGLYLAYKMFSKKNTQDKDKDNKGGSDKDDAEWKKYLEENGYINNEETPQENQPTFEPVTLVELRYRKRNSGGYYDIKYVYSDGSEKVMSNLSAVAMRAAINNAQSNGVKVSQNQW